MSVSVKLSEFLNSMGVAFIHHVHPTAYTALETAASIHVPGKEVAKSVVIKADGILLLAVLPADSQVDLHHLKFVTRSENIGLATEKEFKDAFPSCELGAIPPFGNLFGITTYCDTSFDQSEGIEFNAGSHNDAVRMAFEDFKRLARPVMVDLVDHSRRRAA